jgi:serine O-acetyltransferase
MSGSKAAFKLSLKSDELLRYVITQSANIFPDGRGSADPQVDAAFRKALMRMEYCCSRIRRKYFFDGTAFHFDHLNSDQYAMFLYVFSNSLFKSLGDHPLAKKLYALNKALNGIDVYYEVELPEVFLFRHCVGTVLGRAHYSNYFTVGQNCTVGNNRGAYPAFSEYCAMYSGSTVVGSCKIGTNAHIGARAFVRNMDIPDNSLVTGQAADLLARPTEESVRERFFNSFGVKRKVSAGADDSEA